MNVVEEVEATTCEGGLRHGGCVGLGLQVPLLRIAGSEYCGCGH